MTQPAAQGATTDASNTPIVAKTGSAT